MENAAFLAACRRVLPEPAPFGEFPQRTASPAKGIGTLGEKTLHAVVKYYLEPDERFHEVKVGSYYADICTGSRIIEIQTRQFHKLREKLDAFLPEYQVTIVYPILCQKRIFWIDEETGALSNPRLSPKKGTPFSVFPELYQIKTGLSHPNLRVRLLLLEADEYRLLCGWSRDKKRGSRCSDRIPSALRGELELASPEDYCRLIPPELSACFTSRDLAKAAKITRSSAQTALNVLHSLEAVRRVGRMGSAWMYERGCFSDPDAEDSVSPGV